MCVSNHKENAHRTSRDVSFSHSLWLSYSLYKHNGVCMYECITSCINIIVESRGHVYLVRGVFIEKLNLFINFECILFSYWAWVHLLLYIRKVEFSTYCL